MDARRAAGSRKDSCLRMSRESSPTAPTSVTETGLAPARSRRMEVPGPSLAARRGLATIPCSRAREERCRKREQGWEPCRERHR